VTLITFDFHNTLAHCNAWFDLEVRTLPIVVLERLPGLTVDDEMRTSVAAAYRRVREQVMATGDELDALASVLATLASLNIDIDRDTAVALIDEAMEQALHDLQPVDGAVALVKQLHEDGYRLGIVSSAIYHPFLEWALAAFGIDHCFEFVVTSASAGYYKSSPAIYQHALELASALPHEAVHVGDSVRWDVTTAASIGISTVLLKTARFDRFADAVDLLPPDLTLESFVDAAPRIRALADLARPSVSPGDEAPPAANAAPKLRVDILTLFPQMFAGPFDESILKRARQRGLVEINIHDIRAWTTDKHHTADDTPYGGGAGMVMKAPPIVEAVEAILGDDLSSAHIAITSAAGRQFSQPIANELASCKRLVLICGHYEGIDERVSTLLDADELSIGDYVLTGGELPAMVIVDTIARLIPGVIDAGSIVEESHATLDRQLVEYPHYTRPAEYRGLAVPDILLSGHHAKIAAWREDEARKRTRKWRPDLVVADDSTR
jgi:tRNA (guanine37-N1)-methyltransferase